MKNKKKKSLKVTLIETLAVLTLAFISGTIDYLEQKEKRG